MKIQLSRHARRRAKLYKIPESTILSILENLQLQPGIHEIIKNIEGFKYPLKIVLAVEDDLITVISNYPLRKGRKQ